MLSRHFKFYFHGFRRKMSTAAAPTSPAAIISETLTKKVGAGTVGSMPLEPKMTLKEKFKIFWRTLYVDYRDVAIETFQDAKAKPVKASIYLSIAGGLLCLQRSNPTEHSFISDLVKYDSEVSFISPAIRNPHAETYAHTLIKHRMKGELRYQNFELFSIIWRHDTDKKVGIFEATCKYLKPLWSEVGDRFVDIGALGRWWMLERHMVDYDVNPYEWDEETKQVNEEKRGNNS